MRLRLRRCLRAAGAAVAAATYATCLFTAVASATPSGLALVPIPRIIPATGGAATIVVHVRSAGSCRLVEVPGSERPFSCSSGSVIRRFTWPANTSSTATVWTTTLEAWGRNGERRRKTIKIEEVAPVQPPVAGLQACSPGPHCEYGPIYSTYPPYGNTVGVNLGDCSFAAAADWEQIKLGFTPNESLIGFEFAQAGGTLGGLSQNALWAYWKKYGIVGHQLTGLWRYTTDQAGVENAVLDYGALIAELGFVAEDGFGEETVAAGLHDLVVDGFTPTGPLVVTWGRTWQMTWEQWDGEVEGMWGVGTT
jgi:hypothetical protein